MVIVFGFVVLGTAFLFQVYRFSREENNAQLEKSLARAATATQDYLTDSSIFYDPELPEVQEVFFRSYCNRLRELAEDCNGTIMIGDAEGKLFMLVDASRAYVQAEGEKGRGELPPEAVSDLLETGDYEHHGNFYKWFGSANRVRGNLITLSGGIVGMAFVASPMDTEFFFNFNLARTFILLTMVVLLLTIIASIVVVRSTVKPLSEMAYVARAFARGDFSARVPLPERQDELYDMTLSFNSMADAMEHSENNRRGLMASVSHDLRTPMTTIAGFVDGILDGTIKPEKQDYYLQIISDEVKRLSRMANSMLEVSKLESGETQINKVNFDLSEMVRRIVIGFEQKLNEKNIEVALDIPESQNITADHDSLFQAVYNLIDNAVKYTEENGTITVYMEVKSGTLMFHVINTGSHIDAENLKHVFDRFYTVDRSRQKSSGSGLGLYIVKTIVNKHGGDIYAKSDNSKTEFCFSIPTNG